MKRSELKSIIRGVIEESSGLIGNKPEIRSTKLFVNDIFTMMHDKFPAAHDSNLSMKEYDEFEKIIHTMLLKVGAYSKNDFEESIESEENSARKSELSFIEAEYDKLYKEYNELYKEYDELLDIGDYAAAKLAMNDLKDLRERIDELKTQSEK